MQYFLRLNFRNYFSFALSFLGISKVLEKLFSFNLNSKSIKFSFLLFLQINVAVVDGGALLIAVCGEQLVVVGNYSVLKKLNDVILISIIPSKKVKWRSYNSKFIKLPNYPSSTYCPYTWFEWILMNRTETT